MATAVEKGTYLSYLRWRVSSALCRWRMYWACDGFRTIFCCLYIAVTRKMRVLVGSGPLWHYWTAVTHNKYTDCSQTRTRWHSQQDARPNAESLMPYLNYLHLHQSWEHLSRVLSHNIDVSNKCRKFASYFHGLSINQKCRHPKIWYGDWIKWFSSTWKPISYPCLQ